MNFVFNGYDQAALDKQLDNSRAVPEHPRMFERYRELSEHTRSLLHCRLGVPYGPTEREKLDIFATTEPLAPTWIFIHGGYWRRLDKGDFSFIADSLVPHGISMVSIGYALAPHVTVAEIVRQVRTAVRWVFDHVGEWEGDPQRIFIGGHSVGAQLAALAALDAPVAGLTSISGLHDLEPVRLSYANEWARLRADEIESLSPIHQIPSRPLPLIATVGSEETDEFKRQTAIFAQAWRDRGYPCIELYRPRENHFTIVFELAYRESALSQAITAQCLEANLVYGNA